MIRKIIRIDEEKCDGCGLCANACHEGAIDIIGGKARLVRENFCDGLGDCLPACPQNAISFEEREAPAYDEAAVKAASKPGAACTAPQALNGAACNASEAFASSPCAAMAASFTASAAPATSPANKAQSALAQWPCQIKLVPTKAPFYDGAKLLIAADCTAYAYATLHEDFMRGKVTIIGCPKLDQTNYTEKLAEIIKNNDIKSMTVLRMEVPCCGGMQFFAEEALKASGKFLPWQVITISRNGEVLE